MLVVLVQHMVVVAMVAVVAMMGSGLLATVVLVVSESDLRLLPAKTPGFPRA